MAAQRATLHENVQRNCEGLHLHRKEHVSISVRVSGQGGRVGLQENSSIYTNANELKELLGTRGSDRFNDRIAAKATLGPEGMLPRCQVILPNHYRLLQLVKHK